MPVYEVTAPDGRVFEVTAPSGATQAEVLAYAQKNFQPKQAEPTTPTAPKTLTQSARDLLAGGVRGAGSIGATVLAPLDIARDAIAGKGLSLQSNRERREGMDAGLRSLVGADTESTAFGLGKLAGEIAGTAGAGGALAKPVQALAGTRFGAGIEPLLEGMARGLQTGGMRVGPLAGTSAAMPARIITGAATGATAAGMVNPSDAPMGALVGGALPAGVAAAGKAGEVAGSVMRRPAPATPELLDTARRSMDAGYVIPPSMVKPSFTNRMLESASGKFETAQLAATKNQQITDDLVRKALNLAPDAPLTKEAMATFRGLQYQSGYEPVKQFGAITVGPKFNDSLDKIASQYTGKGTIPAVQRNDIVELVNSHKSTGFDSGDAIDAIRILRERADEAFTKGEAGLGKTYKAIANLYEDAIEEGLKTIGRTDMLKSYRAARQSIAKSFTVEKALREGAGTVDARILGREIQRGKPLTGELRTAAEFGNTFNKAAQPPHLIGSPAVNALKPMVSLLTGAAGAGAMGPAGLALGASNYIAPPIARSVMFSQPFQRGLLHPATGMLDEASQMGLLSTGVVRSAPVLISR